MTKQDNFDHGLPPNKYNPHVWIRGNPEIGDKVWIGPFCVIDASNGPLKIGRFSDIAAGAQILTHSTVKRCITERRYNKIDFEETEIGEFSFIGVNAVVLKGVKLGHHSVVAAGAVVPEGMTIPPYSIVGGVPAKIIGSSKKYLTGVESDSITVAIPAYNEESTITTVVREAIPHLKKITSNYEVVIVDDGSKDKTGKIVDQLASKNKRIRIIHHRKNKGFTGAYRTCLESAKKNLVFLAPADGQFNFSELRNFTEAIKGYDVAIGYRAENEETLGRKLISRLFHFLCRMLFGITLKEFSTVSMWRKYVIESIDTISDDRSAMFLPEIISQAIKSKYAFTEVPIHWYKRLDGRSKGVHLHPQALLKTFLEMFKLWFKVRIVEKTNA